ncbi:uncharacterized protein LOC100187732 precursor [Nasonia vitripennis]|uniref:Protein sleepless n=1 Tax=Nasonia vitripennis TaxID=7425 RepID=A0A7M6UL84_NASVI|nr:uncharacterized protein LOC100187732 precursor [Nasonia vitripennis]
MTISAGIGWRTIGALLIVLGMMARGGGAIDCFKCVSIGGDNESCDDPFHNNGSLEFLQSPCLGGRKGRDGLFPATACIKLAGRYVDTGTTLTVRTCALDSGTLTTDSELIRMSHCGGFYFENRYLRGCVQSCSDADACNFASTSKPTTSLSLLLVIVGTLQLVSSPL